MAAFQIPNEFSKKFQNVLEMVLKHYQTNRPSQPGELFDRKSLHICDSVLAGPRIRVKLQMVQQRLESIISTGLRTLCTVQTRIFESYFKWLAEYCSAISEKFQFLSETRKPPRAPHNSAFLNYYLLNYK